MAERREREREQAAFFKVFRSALTCRDVLEQQAGVCGVLGLCVLIPNTTGAPFVYYLSFFGPTLVGGTWLSNLNLSPALNWLFSFPDCWRFAAPLQKKRSSTRKERKRPWQPAWHHQSGHMYLEPQQDAQVPRRPVVEGVHQIFVRVPLHSLVLQISDAHSQVVTVPFLGIKHSKSWWCIMGNYQISPCLPFREG